jgi:murein DD-endopeptidase MepM/ murein hydrolase activator NlpD
MIFPEFKNKKFGYVNLNFESEKWIKDKAFLETPHPLLDPQICQKMVVDTHKKFGLDFSYGGWLEDRSFLWNGSYLALYNTFTHLGIDINVPSGTKIAADFKAEVVKVDDDHPENGGWGPRVILKHLSKPVYIIYAHLDRKILVKVGDKIKEGKVFAKVGEAPFNGNWFPHLHVQVVSEKNFKEIEKKNLWSELDGYGAAEEIADDAKRFPDPMQYISFK